MQCVNRLIDEQCWITFDLQVGRTLGIGSGVNYLTAHGQSAVVEDERVCANILDDVNILSRHKRKMWSELEEEVRSHERMIKVSPKTD